MSETIIFRDEITVIVYYQEENIIISGAGDGKILFWNLDGVMIKQLSILTTAVTNIHLFKRPYEFEKNDSFLRQKKRPFELAILKKYEEEKVSMDPVNIPLLPQKESLLKKRPNYDENDQPILMKFVKTSFPFFEAKGKQTKGSRDSEENDTRYKELIAENEKLLKMNEKLFSLCFLKDKV